MTGRMVEDRIVRRLREAGGISVEIDEGADLRISVAGGHPVSLILEIRHHLSSGDLAELTQRPGPEFQGVLVTRGLTRARRTALREAGVSWIEYGTGHVHIRVPGVAVDLPEKPDSKESRSGKGVPDLSGKAGLIAEALLMAACKNPVVSQPDIASRTGATHAWVSKVFKSLVRGGALSVDGSGPRKRWTVNGGPMMELWATAGGTPPEESTGLYVWVRQEPDLLERLMKLSGGGFPYAIGGPLAADLYEPTLTSRPPPEVWIPASVAPIEVASYLGGEVVETGRNVSLLQAPGDPALRFRRRLGDWRKEPSGGLGDLFLVSPPRAIAEASASAGRGPEAGSRLREVLSHALEEAASDS